MTNAGQSLAVAASRKALFGLIYHLVAALPIYVLLSVPFAVAEDIAGLAPAVLATTDSGSQGATQPTAAAVAAGAGAGTRMTLKDAIVRALGESPKAAAARADKNVKSLERENSRAKWFPTLDLATTHGLEGQSPSLDPTPPGAPLASRASLTLTQPIYDGGVTSHNQSLADLADSAAALRVLQVRDDVVLSVAQAFYRLMRSSIFLDIRREQRDVLTKRYQSLSEQHRQGLTTHKDVLRLQTEVHRLDISVKAAENAARLADLALRGAMGLAAGSDGPPVTFALPRVADATPVEPDVPKSRPRAAASRQNKIHELEGSAAGERTELVRLRNRPEVTLASDLSYGSGGYLGSGVPFDDVDRWNWNVLLGVKYNLWDSGTRRRDIWIAQSQEEQQHARARQDALEYDGKIESLLANLEGLRLTFQLERKLVELETTSYAQLDQDYRQGRVVYLDLITGLNNLLGARLAFYGTHFDILDGLAEFRFHEGTIYETLVAP